MANDINLIATPVAVPHIVILGLVATLIDLFYTSFK